MIGSGIVMEPHHPLGALGPVGTETPSGIVSSERAIEKHVSVWLHSVISVEMAHLDSNYRVASRRRKPLIRLFVWRELFVSKATLL